ncbi:MAG: class I SAM-dependent methyltransferase [Acidobacteriota bacterium]|nr:class I SAM-dependent methyltransferase [Acidobacteriota bacterium]
MGQALAEWLRLREVADWAARSDSLTRATADHVPGARPLRMLDLATGTGSNLRYLMERLPWPQQWLLVDRSPDLLGLVRARTAEWAASQGYRLESREHGFVVRGADLEAVVETRALDLNLPLDDEIFVGRHLVTASALLDLVSEAWLRALATRCAAAGAVVLFGLTYDGRSSFSPPEPEDDWVRDLLNAHQRRDKGLGGPASGPDAHDAAVQGFEAAGYECRVEVTDWTIGPDQREFQRQLIEGLAGAATEQRPDEAAAIADWRDRRLTHLAAGRSRAVVGHRDLAAWRRGV